MIIVAHDLAILQNPFARRREHNEGHRFWRSSDDPFPYQVTGLSGLGLIVIGAASAQAINHNQKTKQPRGANQMPKTIFPRPGCFAGTVTGCLGNAVRCFIILHDHIYFLRGPHTPYTAHPTPLL